MLLQAIQDVPELKTFTSLASNSELGTLLGAPAALFPLTVFAPSDDAIANAPPSFLRTLLTDPGALADVLK